MDVNHLQDEAFMKRLDMLGWRTRTVLPPKNATTTASLKVMMKSTPKIFTASSPFFALHYSKNYPKDHHKDISHSASKTKVFPQNTITSQDQPLQHKDGVNITLDLERKLEDARIHTLSFQ